MRRLSSSEIQENLDMEFFLERESIAYKVTRGVSGEQLNIKHCPCCGDQRYRVYFGTDTGRGNCFVCNSTFSKSTFVHHHLDNNDNWRATYEEIEGLLREQGWRPKRKAMVMVDHSNVVLPVSLELPTPDGENLEYLERRGFGVEIVRYLNLRWCEFGWWRFKTPEGTVETQSFANRIIIPVFDLDGKLVTFQGRDLTGTSKSKYLFPKELPGTGRFLFNGHNVQATDHVVLGEGAFDVGALKIAYDGDSALRHITPIGSFGKHLSYGSPDANDQLGRFNTLKARGVKFVTIMWDGEEKALEAALNAAKLLSGIGLTVRIAMLPFGKDPNEVLPEVVRAAHYAAELYTPALDIKWRLRNPYSASSRVRSKNK